MHTPWKKFALVSVAVVLAVANLSCGGSSNNPAPPPPPPPGPVNAALTQFASGFVDPVGLVQVAGSSNRFLVLEQRGTIRIIQNGAVLATPFLDIQSIVTSGGETGLLGIALHPQFAQNRRFFLNYTTSRFGALQSIIAEYQVSLTDPNRADPTTERILIQLNQPFDNHNGGQLAFGPDGFLYIAFGDGGDAGDPLRNGQNLQTLLGKILRIDVNSTSTGKQYGIPATNPFASGANGLAEIWAFGLRNPWRFSFDTAGGRLFAGDVGQDSFEEIDIIQRGGNYGWNTMEGAHCFNPPSACNQSGLLLPIFEYNHNDGSSAVIGGFVYRGAAIPTLQGAYVFGDLTSNNIWFLRESPPGIWSRTLLLATGRTISSFGQDQAGEMYVLDYNAGLVLKLTPQ